MGMSETQAKTRIDWKSAFFKALKLVGPYAILFLVCFPPMIIWFKSWSQMPVGHDISWHLGYVIDLVEGWKNGVHGLSTSHYYLGNLAYGIYIFYAPLAHYIVGGLYYIGIPVISAWKIVLFLSVYLSGIWMYKLGALLTKDKTLGFVFGVAYIFLPYRWTNFFIRDAFPEGFAMAFLPLLMLGVFRVLNDEKPRVSSYIYAIVGAACLIITHPFTALTAAILAVFLILANFKNLMRIFKQKQTWFYLPIAVVLILLLVGFYVFPMNGAMKSGYYRMSNEVAVWTNIEYLIKARDGSWIYAGFWNPSWIQSLMDNAGETLNGWIIDLSVFVFFAAGAIVALTLLRRKGKPLWGLGAAIVISLIPLTFRWREEMLFAVPVFTILLIFVTLWEKQDPVKETLKDSLRAEAKNPEIYVLLFALALCFLYLFSAWMWTWSPSILRKCQFPFRFWGVLDLIFILIFVIVARVFRRYNVTKYAVAAFAVCLYVTSHAPIDKRLNAEANRGMMEEPTLSIVTNQSKVGVMNEYMPDVFYQDDYAPTYANSLYATVKNQIRYTHRYDWGLEGYRSPVFLEGEGTMNIEEFFSPNGTFDVTVTSDEAYVQLPQFYYDGYYARFTLDGERYNVKGEYVDGLVAFRLPKGHYKAEVRYVGPTSYRVFAPLFYVGLVGVVAFGVSPYAIAAIQKKKSAKQSVEEK